MCPLPNVGPPLKTTHMLWWKPLIACYGCSLDGACAKWQMTNAQKIDMHKYFTWYRGSTSTAIGLFSVKQALYNQYSTFQQT